MLGADFFRWSQEMEQNIQFWSSYSNYLYQDISKHTVNYYQSDHYIVHKANADSDI